MQDYTNFFNFNHELFRVTRGLVNLELCRITKQILENAKRNNETYNDNPDRCSNTLEALIFLCRACCFLCSCHNFEFKF